MTFGVGERAPWGDFPAVVRNGDLFTMKSRPEYIAAKAGDHKAALTLVQSLLTETAVKQVDCLTRHAQPILLPVLAVESTGYNKIPLAMAEVLGHRLGLEVDHEIVQKDKIGRTGSNSDHRLVCNPTFDGHVIPDKFYFIIDDALTMGGTIASLRGYVENRGGHVLGSATMAARPDPLDLKVSSDMLKRIDAKHGNGMNDLAKEFTGHGLEYLTQHEAGHFRAADNVKSMRDRLTAARNAAFSRVDEPGIETPGCEQKVIGPVIAAATRSMFIRASAR